MIMLQTGLKVFFKTQFNLQHVESQDNLFYEKI